MPMSGSNCLLTAVQQLQHIFPTLGLSALSAQKPTLEYALHLIATSIPVPDHSSSNLTIQSLRQIIDQQEYRYQHSLLQSQISLPMFDQECDYDQASTGILNRKATDFTNSQENRCSMVDDVWGWREEKQHSQQEYFQFLD